MFDILYRKTPSLAMPHKPDELEKHLDLTAKSGSNGSTMHEEEQQEGKTVEAVRVS